MSGVGNTSRDIRKFLRSCGKKPTAERIEAVQREVSRTPQQNERMEREWKERGGDDEARNQDGPAGPRAKAWMEKKLAERKGPR